MKPTSFVFGERGVEKLNRTTFPIILIVQLGIVPEELNRTWYQCSTGQIIKDASELPQRRVTKAIRREMRRRAAVEPVIGHLKDDHRMRRNHLKGRDGDRINAVLAAQLQPAPPLVQGPFARPVMDTLSPPIATAPCLKQRSETFFTNDFLSSASNWKRVSSICLLHLVVRDISVRF
jgi:hypothetical protein